MKEKSLLKFARFRVAPNHAALATSPWISSEAKTLKSLRLSAKQVGTAKFGSTYVYELDYAAE